MRFINDTREIFEGFYESNLWNSDTEFHVSEMLGGDYEVDFDKFTESVAKGAVGLLYDTVDFFDSVITDIRYVGLDSPHYYNFETDRLVMDIDYNDKKLRCYIQDNVEDFSYYLKEKYTSYSGYISFVSNEAYIYLSEDAPDYADSIMLEYYLLRCIYDCKLSEADIGERNTTYHYRLDDLAMNEVLAWAKPVEQLEV